MRNANDQTVLFLFGPQPCEAALLEAQVLASQVRQRGWRVQLVGLSTESAALLGGRFDQSALAMSPGLSGVPLLRTWFSRRLPNAPSTVHAWDLAAAGAARSLIEGPVRLLLSLCQHLATGQIARYARTLRSVDCCFCYDVCMAQEVAAAGMPQKRIAVVDPTVDTRLIQQAGTRRSEIRASLGLGDLDGPLLVGPPTVKRGSGHFETAWATFILRRGGVAAHLVLPHAGKESARIQRFGAACHEGAGIRLLTVPASWLDLVAASDIVVFPDYQQASPALAAYGLASGLPVVAGEVQSIAGDAAAGCEEPLLSARTSLISPDERPLTLARTLLRAWQDRSAMQPLQQTGLELVGQRCQPGANVDQIFAAYRAASLLSV